MHDITMPGFIKTGEINVNLFHCEYLPPYSPDLNPIERVWKLTRRLCVHNRYFSKISELVDLVEDQFQLWGVGNDDLRKLCVL